MVIGTSRLLTRSMFKLITYLHIHLAEQALTIYDYQSRVQEQNTNPLKWDDKFIHGQLYLHSTNKWLSYL